MSSPTINYDDFIELTHELVNEWGEPCVWIKTGWSKDASKPWSEGELTEQRHENVVIAFPPAQIAAKVSQQYHGGNTTKQGMQFAVMAPQSFTANESHNIERGGIRLDIGHLEPIQPGGVVCAYLIWLRV